MPVDRIVRVLQQVGACFANKGIRILGRGRQGSIDYKAKKKAPEKVLFGFAIYLVDFESDLYIDPKVIDLTVFYGCALFMNVDRTDVLYGLRGLGDRILCCVFPAFTGIRQDFYYF